MSTRKLFGNALILLGIAALFVGINQLEGDVREGDPLFLLLKKIQAGTLTETELKKFVSELKVPDLMMLRKVLEEREEYEFAIIVRDELSKKHQV